MASRDASGQASPTLSQLPPVSATPSIFSLASTTNPLSQYSVPLPPPRPTHAVITKADLERSQEAYAELLASAKAYRLALASLSTAASAFGSALEACARLKEARADPIGPAGVATGMSASFTTKDACTADTLMSASGVHYLIANHKQILSETVYRSFEVPLLHDLDKWQSVIDDEEETYQQNIKAQSREVKRLEKEGLKIHKQRRRDVARFRAHLVELTRQLDGLTTLHGDHARTLLRESQETSGRIVDASCSLVRAEVDIFESLARKGWSGGGLDDLLEKGQDLFATEDDSHHSNGAVGGDGVKLFSILPPKSILADSTSAAGLESSLLIETTDRYQSLTAVAAAADRKQSATGGGSGGDNESVFSADLNKPRSARPFSPQPIRRTPTDVTYDTLIGGGMMGEPSAGLLYDDIISARSTSLPNQNNNNIQEENEVENEDEDEDEDEDEMRKEARLWGRLPEGEEIHPLLRRRSHPKDDDDDDDDDDDVDDYNEDAKSLGGGGRRSTTRSSPESQRRDSPELLRTEPSPESTWGSPGMESLRIMKD